MIEINGKNYKTYALEEIDKIENIGFIYITRNKLNGKMYIGQHIKWSETYLGSGSYINHSIRKNGKDSFERFIIDIAKTQNELDKKETYYINEEFNSSKSKDWYNIKDGAQNGGNPYAGMKEEDRKRICKKISLRVKGKGNSMFGRRGENSVSFKIPPSSRMTENTKKEWKRKLSEKSKENPSGFIKPLSIIVYKHGKFYNEYDSLFEFGKELGAKFSDDSTSQMVKRMSKGWIPTKKSKFFGWSIILK